MLEIRDGQLSFSRTLIPNPGHLVPPGYYVSSVGEYGPCAHCGAPLTAHLEAKRFCPLPPMELRAAQEAA